MKSSNRVWEKSTDTRAVDTAPPSRRVGAATSCVLYLRGGRNGRNVARRQQESRLCGNVWAVSGASGPIRVADMPTAHWLAMQKERKDRERWMGNLDAKWEAAEEEDERLDDRWSVLVRSGNVANAALEPADPAAPLNNVAVCVPTDEQLAIALAWLDKDEPEYSDSAATELIGKHEATLLFHAPGASPLTVAMGSAGVALFVVLAGATAAARRVLGLLVTRESGGVDFIVTASAARGKGVAAAAVTRFIQPALSARGVLVDEVESLPSAVRFWAKLGYGVVAKEPVVAPDDAGYRIRTPAALERARKRCAHFRSSFSLSISLAFAL